MLKGMTSWFGTLPPDSVGSSIELVKMFVTQFMASIKRKCLTIYLLMVKQHNGESLKAYLIHLNTKWLTTQDKEITSATFLGDILLESSFLKKLMQKTLSMLKEFIDQEDAFINAEDTLPALKEPQKKEMKKARNDPRKPDLKEGTKEAEKNQSWCEG